LKILVGFEMNNETSVLKHFSSECRIVELLEWTLNDFGIKRNFLSRKKNMELDKKNLDFGIIFTSMSLWSVS